jgi:hypothetical protein
LAFLVKLVIVQKVSLDLAPGDVLIYGYTGKEDDPANEKF